MPSTGVGGMLGGANEQPPRKIELEDVIQAFQKDSSAWWSELAQLREKVARFERAFETMFREELDKRIGGRSDLEKARALKVSELEQLRYELRRNKGEC